MEGWMEGWRRKVGSQQKGAAWQSLWWGRDGAGKEKTH